MPELVERADPEGVDYGWVMQVTFVVTIAVGAPTVAALSTLVTLPTWGARVAFAVRVGAVIWFLTAVGVYVYARRTRVEGAATAAETEGAATAAETEGAATAAETEGAATAAEAETDEGAATAADVPASDGDDVDGEPTAQSDAPAGSDATTTD